MGQGVFVIPQKMSNIYLTYTSLRVFFLSQVAKMSKSCYMEHSCEASENWRHPMKTTIFIKSGEFPT